MISYLTSPTVQHQSLLAAMLLVVMFLVPAALGLWLQWDRLAAIITSTIIVAALAFSGTYYVMNVRSWNEAEKALNDSYDRQLAPYGITIDDSVDISSELRLKPQFSTTAKKDGVETEVVFTRNGNWIKMTDQDGNIMEEKPRQA